MDTKLKKPVKAVQEQQPPTGTNAIVQEYTLNYKGVRSVVVKNHGGLAVETYQLGGCQLIGTTTEVEEVVKKLIEGGLVNELGGLYLSRVQG
jgi:hypothetical protein